MSEVKVSAKFKQMATKAILSIAFFILVYLFLIGCSLGILALCFYGAIMLVTAKPSVITLMLGIGIASVGVFIIIFLVKFLFKKSSNDFSNFTEIDIKKEPKLNAIITTLVNEIGTDFPKKVYLSSEVNASVFYNSSFWSMFLPVKKNLHIGLGLVNATTVSEFKGILAHEFGHFSQKSMKVGSFVYHVNKIIYDMLYDNDSFDSSMQRWANTSNYFIIFIGLSIWIVRGIQFILRKTYEVVNLSYMQLSREMEFHADEIAVNVVGSKPMADSMLRMNLVDDSFNTVLNFYGKKISDAVASDNIFPKHQFVMNFIALKNDLNVVTMPEVTENHYLKFNKSKLTIKDQWASHPSVMERVEAFKKLNIVKDGQDNEPANSLFVDITKTQKEITTKLFGNVDYSEQPVFQSLNNFEDEFKSDYSKNTFPQIFKKYYNDYNIQEFDMDTEIRKISSVEPQTDIFNEKEIDKIHVLSCLKSDIEILENIIANEEHVSLKTFDYDGIKYKLKDTRRIVARLKTEQQQLENLLLDNDKKLFRIIYSKTKSIFKHNELIELYKNYFTINNEFDARVKTFIEMNNAFSFAYETQNTDLIKSKLNSFRLIETKFKEELSELLKNNLYSESISIDLKVSFNQYINANFQYFGDNGYYNEEIEKKNNCLEEYYVVISNSYFDQKKKLLTFIAEHY